MRQVVDSSAVLAYILGEPGGDVLADDDGPFVLSSVNLTEVLTKALDRDLASADVLTALKKVPVEHVVFSTDDAIRAAALRTTTRQFGLSLGDRACLALAQRLSLPAVTADTAWSKLDLDIRLIR